VNSGKPKFEKMGNPEPSPAFRGEGVETISSWEYSTYVAEAPRPPPKFGGGMI